jgi:tetratricopeptide (TPR) repeat protein
MMRYKGTTKTIPEIARELDVDGVVEGAVLRSGDRVRISAQLVHARSDRPVWAESYERDLQDVLALQSEVARDIVEKIRLELSSEDRGRMAASAAPVDPRAYESYLRGAHDVHSLVDPVVRRGITEFEAAIALNPKDARSYAGLATGYLLLCQVTGTMPFSEGLPKVREYAEQALALDPRSPEANTARGIAYMWVDQDWPRAEDLLRRAVSLNPNDANARVSLGIMLTAIGQHDEGLRQTETAIALDPLSFLHQHTYTWQLAHVRRYDEALRVTDRILAVDSTFGHAWWLRARILEQQGRYEEAAQTVARMNGRGPGRPALRDAMLAAYARDGAPGYWRVQRDSTLGVEGTSRKQISHWWNAYVYARLGQNDEAFAALRQAIALGEGDMVFLKVDNFLAPLHADPRYAELVRRMGLPT